MKTTIISAFVLVIFLQNSKASSPDSLNALTKLKRNEISIGVNNMNDIIGANNRIANALQLGYKRRFTDYSLRAIFYHFKKVDLYQVFNFTNDTITIDSYEYFESNVGLKLGIERDIVSFNNTLLFYGIDVNTALVLEKSYPSILSHDFDAFNSYDKNKNQHRHGVNIGLNPIIGITQFYLPNFSSTLEFDILAYYSKIETKKTQINIDEKLRFKLNYNF